MYTLNVCMGTRQMISRYLTLYLIHHTEPISSVGASATNFKARQALLLLTENKALPAHFSAKVDTRLKRVRPVRVTL
jgi:hypothetical protein